MRIAMIGLKGIPFSEDGGGVERHVEELALRLVKLGHEVIAYVRPRFTAEGTTTHQGVKLISIPSIPTKNLDTISYVFFAALHVLKEKVDIVHFHGVGPSTLAWIIRVFKPKAKVVVTFHSIDRFHKKWGFLARLYLAWGEWTACHFAHQTITVSRALQEYCLHKFNKQTMYVPNGVSLRKYNLNKDNKLRKFGLERNGYILTVARLVKHKGIHYLIVAYKKLAEHFGAEAKNWPGGIIRKLVIVGAPSYTHDYLAYLKKLAGDDKNIIFAGFQGGEILAQLFANAYLYVHPSEAEGLSTTILEALSFGKCVLSSDIPENLEALDHGGYSFESKNINDLFEKLIYLFDFEEGVKRRGEHGFEFVKQHFDWDKIVRDVEKVYTQVSDNLA